VIFLKPLLLNVTDKSPLTDAIKRRVHGHHMCYNILVVGDPQTRKSTGTLTLALHLDPKFSLIDDMAVIDGNKFLDVLRAPARRGEVKLADDFGVGLSHRSWQSLLNRCLNHALQTHGFRGLILIVTVPYESYIDSDARKLFNLELTTVSKDDGERWVKFRAEELFHVDDFKTHTTKTYKTLLRVRYPNGEIQKLQNVKVPYPPQPFLDKYFEIANAEKMKLQGDLKASLMKAERERNRDVFNPEKFVSEIELRPQEFIKEWHGIRLVDVNMVQSKLGLSKDRARQIKVLAERKMKINTGWDTVA
jgi:hypothetical protein